ncbi:MAG: hypothetical protein ACRC0X_00560 [Brevinema sp.]
MTVATTVTLVNATPTLIPLMTLTSTTNISDSSWFNNKTRQDVRRSRRTKRGPSDNKAPVSHNLDLTGSSELTELVIVNHHMCAMSMLTQLHKTTNFPEGQQVVLSYTVEYHGPPMPMPPSVTKTGWYSFAAWAARIDWAESRPGDDYGMTLEVQAPGRGKKGNNGVTGVGMTVTGYPATDTCKVVLPLWNFGVDNNEAFRDVIYNEQFNVTVYPSQWLQGKGPQQIIMELWATCTSVGDKVCWPVAAMPPWANKWREGNITDLINVTTVDLGPPVDKESSLDNNLYKQWLYDLCCVP